RCRAAPPRPPPAPGGGPRRRRPVLRSRPRHLRLPLPCSGRPGPCVRPLPPAQRRSRPRGSHPPRAPVAASARGRGGGRPLGRPPAQAGWTGRDPRGLRGAAAAVGGPVRTGPAATRFAGHGTRLGPVPAPNGPLPGRGRARWADPPLGGAGPGRPGRAAPRPFRPRRSRHRPAGKVRLPAETPPRRTGEEDVLGPRGTPPAPAGRTIAAGPVPAAAVARRRRVRSGGGAVRRRPPPAPAGRSGTAGSRPAGRGGRAAGRRAGTVQSPPSSVGAPNTPL